MLGKGFSLAQWSKAADWGLRSKIVGSIPSHPSNFLQKISKISSVKVIVICSDSYKVHYLENKGPKLEYISIIKILSSASKRAKRRV